MTRYFRGLLAVVTGLLLLTSCAKLPSGGSSDFTKRLVFIMTVDGVIRTGAGLPYVYIFALRLSTDSNPIDDGPLPVVIPGGNGFVAGNCTHFILWNPLDFPEYQIFKFLDPGTLNQFVQTGIPINYVQIGEGDDTLQFEIDLSQLVPAGDVDTIKSIQVNFLTMNNTNTSGAGRLWDALGDSREPGEINSYFTFNLDFSDLFTNQNTGNIEPPLDVDDPDLDIVDWSIELRLP